LDRPQKHIQQRKSLSQVFLKQQWPVQRVVEKVKSWGVTRVLEIGPGGSILTKALLDADLKVTAVERDPRFAELNRDLARTRPNLSVVHSDILKFDIAMWLAQSKEKTAIVGNLPYHISTPILLWGLPWISEVVGMVFMVQLEFAQRVVAGVGTKSYGSLSVFTQLRAQALMECKVGKECFSPVPAVDSAIFSLQEIESGVSNDELQKVEQVTRECFMQRRKMMRNGIKQWIKDRDMEKCPIDLQRRPETLSPQEYVELTRFLFPS